MPDADVADTPGEGRGVPPRSVLEAWAVDVPVPLAGGRREAFRAGDLVLKPAGEPAQAAWLAELLDGMESGSDVRIIRPVRAVTGRWIVDGWAAWRERDAELPELVRPLLARRHPVDLPGQLIHGDLGGNVLFCDSLPPAVIDLSPYWRPTGYADALVVADAVAWDGAGDDLVERLLRRQGEQLLLRAVLFRVAADPREAEAHQRVVALLEA